MENIRNACIFKFQPIIKIKNKEYKEKNQETIEQTKTNANAK